MFNNIKGKTIRFNDGEQSHLGTIFEKIQENDETVTLRVISDNDGRRYTVVKNKKEAIASFKKKGHF